MKHFTPQLWIAFQGPRSKECCIQDLGTQVNTGSFLVTYQFCPSEIHQQMPNAKLVIEFA